MKKELSRLSKIFARLWACITGKNITGPGQDRLTICHIRVFSNPN